MRRPWLLVIVPGILAFIAVFLVIMLLLVKVLWAWTIPDLFPGAVEQGLVAESISWFTAFKVAIFAALLSGLTGMGRFKKRFRRHKSEE